MSDSQADSPAPRRSQRDKKIVKPFVSAATVSAARKRKRNDSDTEDDAPHAPDPADADRAGTDDENDADEEDAGYHGPKSKSPRKGKAKSSPKTKSAPTTKKPRTEKGAAPKPPKMAARRGRKPKEGENAYDAEQVAKDTKISADNPLFNAIMNPASALQSSAEDFLQSLNESPGAALAELINLVLRSCGCNDSVDADQAVDYDGIVSTLDDFTEALKQENSPIYPLTSKLPIFKRFRRSLSEWIERLITSASDLDALYSTQLMDTLQQWVVSMSSSQIRSFRHTATVIALDTETALCDVAVNVEKEAEVVDRQREGEKKRKGTKGGNPRVKELDGKASEIKQRRTKVSTFIKEFFNSVFVHRYRDLDPAIRADCVRALGLWLRKYPKHFLNAPHLLYVGWLLSDTNTHVRLEAVKAVAGVYEQEEYIASLNTFTQHFKARLVKMATSDTELSVRVAVIQVLGAMDGHRLLEEEETEKLCLLLFDEDAKVRRVVSQFVHGEWEDQVNDAFERIAKPGDKDKERVGVKILARLLVQWCKELDALSGDADESENGDVAVRDDALNKGTSRRAARRKEVLALVGAEQQGRIAHAVDALWGEVDAVSNWESILEVLLLDHSASEDSQLLTSPRGRARANGKKHTDEYLVNEDWRLEEVEETILLQVLLAALRRAKGESAGGKKGEEENVSNDITRALIKGLPRLFIKYQTDQKRISDILLMPTLMNLDLYLEMRMITAYTALWDDVIKQFISHSSVTVLSHAMTAIRHFMDATSLSNSNSTKILELEDELSTQLRDTVAGRDEIEVASFSEDEVVALSAWCTRLAVLSGTRNMTVWVEEDEGGKQSSAWDIINALVERGRLGYKEEETMIEQALHVLTLHIFWKTKGLTADAEPTPEDIRYREVLQEQRESLLEKLVEYAVGTQSNTVEGVKRAAFKHLLDLHVLFSANQTHSADGTPLPYASMALSMDDETQYRCAGYIQAEIERYAEFLDEDEDDEESEKSDDGSDEEEDEDTGKGKEKEKEPKKKKAPKETDLSSRDLLEKEYLFIDVVSTFLRAIRTGAIHLHHGAVVLAHYGRLEVAFDTCSKIVVDVLREEHIMKNDPGIIVATVTQAIQEGYTLVLDGVVRDESNLVLLAKLLTTCFVVRGSQLSVLRRLDNQHIIQVQTTLLSWIAKRIAGYEKNKNKKGLKASLNFFKVLVPLLGPIASREALKLKAHMDQAFDEAKVEIPASSSKIWEPLRAYEKRLGAIMSKDKPEGSKPKKPRKGKSGITGAASGEEESEGDKTGDEINAPPRPRPKPKRVTRANPIVVEAETAEVEEPPVTPKARPRPKAVYRRKSPESPSQNDRRATPVISPPPAGAENDEDMGVTPKSSNKRPREDDEEEEPDVPNGTMRGDDSDVGGTPDVQVRRKRIRH